MKYSKAQSQNTQEIKLLFTDVFTQSEGEHEGQLIGDLSEKLLTRESEEDVVGFVASEEDEILGSIIFSKLSFDNGEIAFLLGPVAVHSDHHGKGIGQALIKHGLDELKSDGVKLAITYGDPNFYSKVGFEQITEDVIRAPLKLSYPHGWLAQSLTEEAIKPINANSSCVETFNNQSYW